MKYLTRFMVMLFTVGAVMFLTNVNASAKNSKSLYVGDTYTLPKKGAYKVSSSAVSVSKKGVVKAVKKGTAVVTVVNGTTGTDYSFTISKRTLNKTSVYLKKKGTYILKLTGASASKVKWKTSNKKVATISKKGKLKAVKSGSATITATYKKIKYTCKVKVYPMQISDTNFALKKGQSKTLTLYYATKKNVKWSTSNKKVATVNKNGKVTAKKNGTVYIYAKYNGKRYKAKLKVVTFKLSKTSLGLINGSTSTLKVTNKSSYTVKWSSANKKAASVSSKGKVTGVNLGTTTVKAKIENQTLSCKVNVSLGSLSNGSTITMNPKQTYTLNIPNVTFKSSATSIATVTSKGVITAKKNGTAKITVSANGKSEYIYVKVVTASLTIAAITQNNINTAQLSLNSNAQGTWSSSDHSVATIDANGVITPVKEGPVTFTYKSGTYSKTQQVYVKALSYGTSFALFRKYSTYLVSMNYISASGASFYSYDDFVNGQIKYVKYTDAGTKITTSGWKSTGQILDASYKYILRVRRNTTSKLGTTSSLSDAADVRFENTSAKAKNTSLTSLTGKMIAHRGLNTVEPENSTAAFSAAGQKSIFWGIESDVYDTSDGELVMIHDSTLNRTVNISETDANYDKSINGMTFSTIESYTLKGGEGSNLKVPTLKEYLQICKQYNKYAVLELKGITQYASLKKVVDTIQETGMSNQTVLISFHLGWLENVYTSVPGGSSIPMLALYQNALTAENYTYLSHTGFSGVDQYWKVATTAELQACQKVGLAYGVWTITTTTSETTASSLVKQDMNFVTLNSDTVAKSVLDAASEQSESQAKDETKNPVDSSGTTDSSKSDKESDNESTAPVTDPDDGAGTTQTSSTPAATK
jgi:glycerophosphoryl diester phosphodiesterase/uncharacterized protein YjdB